MVRLGLEHSTSSIGFGTEVPMSLILVSSGASSASSDETYGLTQELSLL